MSIAAQAADWPPDHLLALEEWEQLPEDNTRHYELVEGVLLVSPRARARHQRVMAKLATLLDAQLPDHLATLVDSEVVIQASFPPTVRAPDVIVVPTELALSSAPRVDASDVLLAVEVISQGTSRTDRVTKFSEYAEAKIRYYWIVEFADTDQGPWPVLSAYNLVQGSRYVLDCTVAHDACIDVENTDIEFNVQSLVKR